MLWLWVRYRAKLLSFFPIPNNQSKYKKFFPELHSFVVVSDMVIAIPHPFCIFYSMSVITALVELERKRESA